RAWWYAQDKRKKEVQVKLILSAQIRRYLSNLTKDASKRKPPLEVFRSCEQRIGKLGDPLLLQQFYAAVLPPETYAQLPESDPKRNAHA
ncbi:MAG: hypothetical protein AAGA66_19940, partial [Bacteroidota bacterium]